MSRLKHFILLTIFFFIAAVVLILLGAMIGYGILGQSNPFHVFSPAFWETLFKII